MDELEKYALLFIDIIKEAFILFLALVFSINFSLFVNEYKEDGGSEKDGANAVYKHINTIVYPEDCTTGPFLDSPLCTYNATLYSSIHMFLSSLAPTKDKPKQSFHVFFVIFIGLIYAIITTIVIAFGNNASSWNNVGVDFSIKLSLIFFLPLIIIMLIISSGFITLINSIIKKKSKDKLQTILYFTFGIFSLYWMAYIVLNIPLFIIKINNYLYNKTVAVVPSEINSTINSAYQNTLMTTYSMMIILILIYTSITTLKLYYYIMLYPRITLLLKVIKDQVQMKQLYLLLKLIISIVLLHNIYNLFAFIYFIFAFIIFIIFLFILIKNYLIKPDSTL